MRLHLLTYIYLLCFVPYCFSYGTNKSFSDYVVTLNNDTIHGYIDNKNWKKTPDQILFKENLAGSGFYYTPNTILEFHSDDKIYRRAIVKIDQSQHITNKHHISPEFQFIIDTVFLQAIILGEKELYYRKDSIGKEGFYIKKDSIYEWLTYKKYQNRQQDKKVILFNNNYIGQLLLYLQNCPTINSVLSETKYNIKSLSKVFYYYYDCTNKKIVYQENRKRLKLFFWLK